MLTDLIELDRKREFETEILPRLRSAITDGAIGGRDQLVAWLRAACKELLPGADPLPALGAPLANSARAWERELPASAGLRALCDFVGGKTA